jgi:CDP-6-deoxy-D-xylo-4-hexulose-3-dehydrase
MSREQELRGQISDLVAEFYRIHHAEKEFVPGQTPVSYAGRVFDEREIQALVQSSLDFWLTLGPEAEKLERNLAKFIGTRFCRLVNSGSSANLLAFGALTSHLLKGRRILPGSEVITVAAGFPTTVTPIFQYNCVPVFIDVEAATKNVDVSQLEAAVSEKTRAVMLAHTLGNPFDVDAVLAFCEKYDLFLVEDNCDALGSTYKGRKTGSFGHVATESFYPAHHMTMGEGGAVFTSDAVINKIVDSLRDWGRDCWCASGKENTCGKRFEAQYGSLPYGYDHKYVYSHLGYNLKPLDIQAAIGLVQLEKIPSFIEARKRNFSRFYAALKKYETFIALPQATAHSEPSWFGFTITVRDDAGFTRDDMVQFLEGRKIQTRMLFGGNLIKQPAIVQLKDQNKYRVVGPLSNTEKVLSGAFWIGVYPGLTEKHMEYIIGTFDDFFKSR